MQPHRLRDDDPHRLQCPRRHSSWEPVNGGFWCASCERRFESGAFELVRDAKTGEMLDREAVRALEDELRVEGVA